jgi:molybdate transport system substrate-binding protein
MASSAATEIKVLSATAMKEVLGALASQIERATGCGLAVSCTTSGGVAKLVAGGEAADLIILAATEMGELIRQGKVLADSTIEIARSNIGVGVRKDTPKPDISSADAFGRALIAAKTVAYTDPAAGGASGTYLAGLLDKMGIADKIETKLAAGGPDGLVGTIVARGDAEIGLHQIPELIAAGVEVVGPLPAEIQKATVYAVGIPADARYTDASKAVIAFLATPAAAAAVKAQGMEAS